MAGATMYKVCCVVVGIALFLPLWMLAQPSTDNSVSTLAAMRDRSRPLLIFYPQDPAGRPLGRLISLQRTWIESHKEELQKRDVVPMYVPSSGGDGEVPSTMSLRQGLRRQFHIHDREFAVVLVGKDGGEKFRSHEPVTIEKLDALIDAMPMRQQEVRDGEHTK